MEPIVLRCESPPCIDAISGPGMRVYDGVVGECDGMEYCRLNAVLPALGKMDPRWLRIGEHRGLRKRVLESSRLKDSIRAVDSECYGPGGEPKDSVDQDTLRGLVTYYVLFCATRGRTRIYQGSWRSGVLPPVPYRAVHWGQLQGAKRSGQCSLRPVDGQPNREGTLRLLASGQLGARVEGYDQCK